MRRRRSIIRAAAVAVVAFSLLAAGCGGGGSPGVAGSASATTSGTSSATGTAATQHRALAFARCMRAHGIPGWPDPTSSGVFDKAKLRQLGVSVSRVRALEEGACNHLLGGQPQAYAITAADRADYLRAAACIRSHGFPNFPDPTFRNDDVTTNVPSSIDQDSSPFKSAAAICTKLIPAGLPYSSSNRS